MGNIKKFIDFIGETLIQKNSLEQLKKVRKISKDSDTDIGDQVEDEPYNRYARNIIDDDIETFQDFENKNKKFNPGWNTRGEKPFKK